MIIMTTSTIQDQSLPMGILEDLTLTSQEHLGSLDTADTATRSDLEQLRMAGLKPEISRSYLTKSETRGRS